VFASNQSIRQVAQYSLGDPSLAPQVTANVLNGAFGPGAGDAWLALGQPPYDAFDIDVRVKEMAGFFDVTRKLGGGWEASIGGRLYHTSSGGVATNTGFLLDLTGFVGGRTVDDTVRDNGFDPKASLSWHVTGDAMLYAAASKGYRVGGVQWGNSGLFASTPAPNLFKTDSIWNYEAGLRSRWLNDTLRFDSTVFYERWKNPQVLVFVSNGLGAYIDNVGGVESKGVETSLQYIFPSVPGLKLTAAATYTDAKTTEDFVTAVASELITKGTTWPLSPKWQSAATIDYQHGFGNWYWGGYLTHAYLSGATYGIGQPDPVFGYGQLDAQLRFGATAWRTQPELSLTMTNVADKRGISTSYSGVFWQEVTYVQPRTLTLRVTGRL
jgi:iron complex outermembrane receptor protein